jgi:hypothetical protein
VVSQLKVNEIIKQSGSTLTIGQDGDTVSGPFTNTPAFEAYRSSNQTPSNNTLTKVQFDTEILDSDGCYDNSTNHRFTPTKAGKYFVYAQIRIDAESITDLAVCRLDIYKNGSRHKICLIEYGTTNDIDNSCVTINALIDMNGTTDYLEIYGYGSASAQPTFLGSSGDKATYFGAYRITGA